MIYGFSQEGAQKRKVDSYIEQSYSLPSLIYHRLVQISYLSTCIMQRRSSQRTPRKKYTTDAFTSIPELRDASESPSRRDTDPDNVTDDDDAFEADAASQEPSDVASEGEATNEDDDDDVDDADDDGVFDDVTATPGKKYIRIPKVIDENSTYSRGLHDSQRFHLTASKEAKRVMYWGADPNDVASVHRAIDKWVDVPVLPTHEYGFHGPYLVDSESYHGTVDHDWEWCSEGSLILKKQIVTVGSLDEVKHLLPASSRAFLLGPLSNPKQFMLAAGECIPMQAAFSDSRKGFILNIGARVQCLDWLPHQPGRYQYLAIATTTKEPGFVPGEAPDPPAYTPTTTYEALLHIWRFNVSKKPDTPRMKAIVATKFGGVKRFRFCPFPARSNGPTPFLLASLYSDGGLRVMIIPEFSDGDNSDVLHVTQALIETKAPDTIFTCFTWMSPRRIAAGCANGCVAIFDLQNAIRSDSHNLKPQKYSAVSQTYIVDMASCNPSSPNMLFTSSMDGFPRLTDTSQTHMGSPSATAFGPRVRSILTNCVWIDYIRSVVLTDDTFGVRLHLARRLFNLFTIGRLRSSIIAMAVSPCHPFLLMGTAGGDVQSLNPMIKVTDTKASVWQQICFAHEWRRGYDAAGDDPVTQHVAEEGLSRFTEGFKTQKMPLAKMANVEGVQGGFLTNTVYEKQTAVTALAWNPNPHVGGWAASGMADGLVRVEDLALP